MILKGKNHVNILLQEMNEGGGGEQQCFQVKVGQIKFVIKTQGGSS